MQLGRTAEDMIAATRTDVMQRMEVTEKLLEPCFHLMEPEQQVLMMRALDEANERRRVVKALETAERSLCQPSHPQRDESHQR
jgi:hypothetical protein